MSPAAKPATALAKSDPVMAALIERSGEVTFETRRGGAAKTDAFGALVRAVVAQQLSSKVAPVIHARVLELFGERPASPKALLALEFEALRACGLSARKVEYIVGLAEAVASGEIDLDAMEDLGDAEVEEQITALRGFGPWSAQVFLMFHLERPDILPAGDLGIRTAVRNEYGLGELPDTEQLTEIAEPWRPNRTHACLYLWHSLRNTPLD